MAYAAGEDRSNYQRVAPWTQDFGLCKATEGLSYQDPTFASNWANLRAEGKPRFAYHFHHPALDTHAQVSYFLNYVRGHGLIEGDGLVLDAETLVGANAMEVMADRPADVAPRAHVAPQVVTMTGPDCRHDGLPTPVYGATGWCEHCHQYCGGISTDGGQPVTCVGCATARASFSALAAGFSLEGPVRAFLDELAGEAGPHFPVLLYTYQHLAEQFSPALAAAHPNLWIASYGVTSPGTGPWSTWKFWQTGAGNAPGGGDSDVYDGDPAQLNEWVSSFRAPAPPPSPQPVPQPDPVPGEPLPAWQEVILSRLPELRIGALDQGGHTEWVRQAQLLLDVIAVAPATADGAFGQKTLVAVEDTQRAKGLLSDGVVGPKTWQVLIAGALGNALPVSVATGAVDHVGEVSWVHRIQVYCNTHGIPTSIDGDFGPGTKAAVQGIQRAYGETDDGVVGPITWSLLIAHARP